MDSKRSQIRRIIDYQSETARREFEERRQVVYAEHSAHGRLQSGATIRRVIKIMEDVAAAFVSDSVEKISAVAQDMDAFGDLSVAVADFWRFLETQLNSTLGVAGGSYWDVRGESASIAAKKLFDKSRALVLSKLELYRFMFTKPSSCDPKQIQTETAATPSVVATNLKTGGRPLAEHWDDMWAAIAVGLYTGDLKPKSQADIERAMLNWLEGKGYDAATSTVRLRARRLWDRMSAEN